MADLSSTKSDSNQPLRLRVFAGPNGSGKSTIIHAIKNLEVNGHPIDFGHYINADDIAQQLRIGPFSLDPYQFQLDIDSFMDFAKDSGLINDQFSLSEFKKSFKFTDNQIRLVNKSVLDQVAQLIARYLREQLLLHKKRFSFETVFSHPSNLDIMKRAAEQGYKVYLYFVSTQSPEINKYRVKVRVEKGGHDVPKDKIESRYIRSLDLLFDAAQLSYQVYFFDNSLDGEKFSLFAHFKQTDGVKDWEKIEADTVPDWFITNYSQKVKVN